MTYWCSHARVKRCFVDNSLAIGVATLFLLLGHTFARAGGWQIAVTSNGTPTATYTINETGRSSPPNAPWTAPGSSTNQTSLGQYSPYYQAVGVAPGQTASVSSALNLSITITGTWRGSDPPPSSIVVIETAKVEGYTTLNNTTTVGSASDGLGDSVDANGVSQTSSNRVYWSTVQVSGSTFTVNRTFSASATISDSVPSGAQSADTIQAMTRLDSYTFAVHAQPYNLHETSYSTTADGTGSLTVYYSYSSTTGNVSDLSTCYFHENVTYDSETTPSFTPPAPFSMGSLANPTVNPSGDVPSALMSSASPPGTFNDEHDYWPSSAPYSAVTVTAHQQYLFDDTLTKQSNVLIPGTDNTATITRQIYTQVTPPYTTGNWYYSLTKTTGTSLPPVIVQLTSN